MDKATNAVNKLDEVQTGKPSSNASYYKKAARQTIANAYETLFDENWKPIARAVRENATEEKIEKTNRVIDAVLTHGAEYVIFGDGRTIIK